jgi:type IV secretion system protein VirD4
MPNRAFGEFGLPRPRGGLRNALLLAGLLGALLYGAACAWVTQSLAARLRYQDALGEPVLEHDGRRYYVPWAVFAWRDALGDSQAAKRLLGELEGRLRLGATLSFMVSLGLVVLVRQSRVNRINDAHGSAGFATLAEVQESQLLGPSGVILGGFVDPITRVLRWLRNDGFSHSMSIGPTGLGKGIAKVIPTCLTWRGSMIIHDPKGENFKFTSGYRATLGPVYRIDLVEDPSKTAGSNPLLFVQLDTNFETADAQRLAREIVDPDGEQFRSKNKHFVEGAASLIAGGIVHVLYKHRALGLPPPGLYDILLELTDEKKIEGWKTFRHDPSLVKRWMTEDEERTPTHPFVQNTAQEYCNRRGDEKANILSSAVTPLSLYRDQVLRANTSYSSFQPLELVDGERPATVYIVTRPEHEARTIPLTRMFLSMVIGRLTPPMEFDDDDPLASQHRHRLLLLLDEFPMLGRMDFFPKAMAWMRGWGITAYLFAQGYSQLTAAYGKDETVTLNCEFLSVLRPNDLATAEMLSRRAGKTTVTIQQPSPKLGGRPTYTQTSRDLLTPDEILRLKKPFKVGKFVVRGGDMLVFGGERVIFGRQPRYFADPVLRSRAKIKQAPPFPAGSPRFVLRAAPRLEEEEQRVAQALRAAVVQKEALATATASHVSADEQTAPGPVVASATEPSEGDYDAPPPRNEWREAAASVRGGRRHWPRD